MQKFIPLFPLEIVVYPKEKLNLHIFEPRYIQLIKEIQESGKTFAIPSVIKNHVSEFITEMELLSIEKTYPDGKMDIKTKGKSVLRLLHYLPIVENKLYPGGIVSEFETEISSTLPINPYLIELLVKLQKALSLNQPLFQSFNGLCAYDLAHYVSFSMEEKYHLLTIPTEKQRQGMIYQHLFKVLPTIQAHMEVIQKIQLNGHFKNLLPPNIIDPQ